MDRDRKVRRVRPGTSIFGDEIEWSELREGDRFRIETTNPKDHLYQDGKIYTALEDARIMDGAGQGNWGLEVEVRQTLSRRGPA